MLSYYLSSVRGGTHNIFLMTLPADSESKGNFIPRAVDLEMSDKVETFINKSVDDSHADYD